MFDEDDVSNLDVDEGCDVLGNELVGAEVVGNGVRWTEVAGRGVFEGGHDSMYVPRL